jgi:hypothetical protein
VALYAPADIVRKPATTRRDQVAASN